MIGLEPTFEHIALIWLWIPFDLLLGNTAIKDAQILLSWVVLFFLTLKIKDEPVALIPSKRFWNLNNIKMQETDCAEQLKNYKN